MTPSVPPRLSFRDWSPSPLVRASLWAHGAIALTALVQPQAWPALLGLIACNQALLIGGMHPRSAVLGANLSRLPAREDAAGQGRVALTFDDGPHPDVTPRVLDILDAYGARASFFVIGERVARHPRLLREILRRGHGVENHTQRHLRGFACRGPLGQWREITQAQHSIIEACGQAPRFFRAPMGLRNPLLDPVLAMAGLTLVSWTRRGYDTIRRDPDRVLNRLVQGLADRDILLLHDGNSATDAKGQPVVLTVLPRLLDRIAAAGLTAVSVAGVPPSPNTR